MSSDSLRFLGLPETPSCGCLILDKETSVYNYIQYMFDRTNTMFRYTGLPDTIPEPMLEYMLQIYGSVAVLEHKDSLYAIRCNFGGPPDPYYRPTQAVCANPALALTNTYRVVNHLPPFDRTRWESCPPCVRFLNDTQILGLFPLFSRYAWQLTENDISIRSSQINLRAMHIISANNGPEIESAQAFIRLLEDGHLSAIAKQPLLDGIDVINTATGGSNTIVQLIELQQYIKASWANEVGLDSNPNFKREYISASEIDTTSDMMLPLVDNMYECRQQALDAINKQFGTNITVEKSSAWAYKQLEAEMAVSIDPENGDTINASLVDYTDDKSQDASFSDVSESESENSSDIPDGEGREETSDTPSEETTSEDTISDETDQGKIVVIPPDEGEVVVTVDTEEGGEENADPNGSV